jgi:hypothetical protein
MKPSDANPGDRSMCKDQERGKYMSDAVRVKKPAAKWEAPAVKPLDEAVWKAWIARGRARDRQDRETGIKALKWGSIVALLAVAGLWSQLMSYDTVIRCVLAAAAVGMMFETFSKRQYALGAVFAGLAVLYNPVAPIFDYSGNWQRALVIASAIPFVLSLAKRDLKAAHID